MNRDVFLIKFFLKYVLSVVLGNHTFSNCNDESWLYWRI